MGVPFQSYGEWFAARRSALSRGGLWLAGNEPGRPDPAGFATAKLRILICRLSPYDDVVASITHRLLLDVARAIPGVYADLAFFPPESDAVLLKKDGVPFWLATGAKRAPADFDVVAISLSVQQEAANLPAALHESGLRLDHAGRMADARHPLILLGGHGAGSVPFVHGDAAGPGTGGLVDAVCLGDGVAWLREFAARWLAGPAGGPSKPDFLLGLARELPGTYVPALYRHGIRDNRLAAIEPVQPGLPLPVGFRQDPMEAWLEDYRGGYIPFSEEETEETLPLATGCAYRCRFCQTGWMRREFSVSARKALVKAAGRFKAAMVNSDLNLLASDACSVPDLEPILDALCPLFRHVSIKSLSVASLVRRPESMGLLRKLAKHEFTFGVEGISARLRAWLGKPATADDLLRIVAGLAGGGLRQLKLFFIATGLEEERDWAELDRLLKNIHAHVPGCRIIASFMPLFCAPFTPLQYARARPLPADVARTLPGRIRHAGGEFRWSAYPDEIALMNRLCRAGRAATPALVDFSIRRGLRYDRRLDPVLIGELARILPDDSGEKDDHAVFPWSDLQPAADPETLWKSYQKACGELQAAPAAEVAAKPVPLRPPPPPTAEDKPAEPVREYFWARIGPEQAGHPNHVIVRGLLRGLFAEWKKGAAAYLGSPRLLHPPGMAGLAVVSAEFKLGSRIPAKIHRLEPVDFSGIQEESCLFVVQWPAAQPAARLLERLKQGRVKFQTIRHGTSRWHIVERAFRGKTGVAALQEDAGQTVLYSQANPAILEHGRAAGDFPAGTVFAILGKSADPCPACKGPLFTVLKSDGTETPPPCFDCLARPKQS